MGKALVWAVVITAIVGPRALRTIATPALSSKAAAEDRGSIHGVVDVRHAADPSSPGPRVAALGMASAHDMPDRDRCVVYLEKAPDQDRAAQVAARATLDQRGEAFIPYVLPIQVGTTVSFPNHDRTYHNVFSLSKAQRFDLGRYPRGESRFVRFDRPGEVRVFCEIHSHMSAYILVFAHPFFAATDDHGRFEIAGVPQGTYPMAVWHDGAVRVRRVITVASGTVSHVDLVVE